MTIILDSLDLSGLKAEKQRFYDKRMFYDKPEHREFALLTIRYFMDVSEVSEEWFERMVLKCVSDQYDAKYYEDDEGVTRNMATISE